MRELERRAHSAAGLGRHELDITRADLVEQAVRLHRPNWLLNAAAYNQVDVAEKEPLAALQANGLAVRHMAACCRDSGVTLLHFSTDHIFDGRKTTPYTEDDLPNPVSAYGVSKLAGELYARAYLDHHYIVRTAGVFGPAGRTTNRGNFVELMLRKAAEGQVIRVVEDYYASPTYAPALAARSLDLLERAPFGTYHIGGGSAVSWYQYALMIFAEAGLRAEVLPTSQRDYPTPARRPQYSVLSNARIESLGLDPMPPSPTPSATTSPAADRCQGANPIRRSRLANRGSLRKADSPIGLDSWPPAGLSSEQEEGVMRQGFWPSVVLSALLAAPAVRAQVLYGSLVGTVQDSSGAVVPAATVTATHTGTGQVHTTTSSSTGGYSLPNLLPGAYDLTVTAPGFRAFTQKNVNVTVNTVRREDVRLELGQVSETVTVQAAALALQTEKTDVHAELNAQAVVNLPLPRYRNYQSLINLVPGATPGVFQNTIQAAPSRALSTNVNGVNRNNNATRIDGALSVFLWLPHHSAYVPPAETIETVNIATNNFDAEQGMAGGAAITVVTKSGTNDLHGTAFAFHDNSRLRARNFFNTGVKPFSNTNIDGFTLGGPIVKNKLFYFGGWEGNRERLGFNTVMTIATADQRRGDFSAYMNPTTGVGTIFDPSTGNPDGAGRAAFAGNMIPMNRQSAITRRLQDLVPPPNRPGTVANFTNSATQKLNRDNFDVKINWNRRDTHSIWGKYSLADSQAACQGGLGAAGGPPLCQGSIGVGDLVTQSATLGHTKTFSPTFLWDGLVGWTRQGQAVTGAYFGQNFGLDTLRIPGTNGPDVRESGAPQFAIGGYSIHGGDTDTRPFFMNDSTWTTAQNFGWTRGQHDLRFGFEGARHHLNHYSPDGGGSGGPQGRFDFTSGIAGLRGGPSLAQFNAYAAFLLGLPETMRKAQQYEKMTAFNNELAWYIRDRWQVSRSLTLSLGLRYELYPMMTRGGRGGIEGYDPETNLVSLGGVGGIPRTLGISTSKKLFAPRVGFAWRLGSRTVIRSGYGITFNPMPLARPLRGFFPLTLANLFVSPNAFQPFRPIEQGIPTLFVPDLSSGRAQLPLTSIFRFVSGAELHRGYVQSWNLIVERELPGQFITSIGYVGTQTVRSFADLDINAAAPGGGTAGRPLFARHRRSAETWAWNGFLSANYHALQLAINRRAADGLVVKGAYTYSRAINFTDDDGWAGVTFNYLPHFHRNRAQAGYNIPHVFQLGYVYELPFGKGKKYAASGPPRWIAGNWQVNGVFAAFQGRPFTVAAAGAALNAPGNGQTADQIKPVVERRGSIGLGQFFYDPTAFAAVNQVRFGSSGRNLLRGPGVVNLDLGVFRRIPVSERVTLEFRAEAYNSMNTPHFSNPGNNVNAGNFMQVLAAEQDQRQFRFGLRLAW